jgi:FkbM family methyltransferase
VSRSSTLRRDFDALRQIGSMPDRRLLGWRLAEGAALRFGARVSFSQEGEDCVISRFFDGTPSGFYVDVGAHHPIRFSNTFALYLRGWHGVNIDAQPGSMKRFRRLRPRDVNLELAVGSEDGSLVLTQFDEPALNTLDPSLIPDRLAAGYRVIGEATVRVQPLATVLDQYVGGSTDIDLLTVDVEGLDVAVLSSNDWNRYRPRLVCVESLRSTRDNDGDDATRSFCESVGYRVLGATYNSLLFEDSAR